jgi:hypothetical protein
MRPEIKNIVLILLLQLVVVGCTGKMVLPPDEAVKYDTVDFSFLSHKFYSAITPWFNPFTEISFSFELTSPSGRMYSVPGFYDGNGKGGLHGRVFKVRICPDEVGEWRWLSHSNLTELDQLNGELSVTGAIDGSFSQGSITVLKKDPEKFAFSNQKPHFLVGKFLDIDQPLFLKYSHTFFSEQWTDIQREQFLNHQIALGVNKINLYLANKGDYKSIATTPWLGSSSHNIKSRFDLHKWHQFDEWIKRFRDKNIAAHLWLFADDSGFNQLSSKERNQLVSYAMARLSGHVNTLFTLALEWQEGFSERDIRQAGVLAQSSNPWDRLISVHGVSVNGNKEDRIFFNEDWLDFIEIQTGFVDHHRINELGNIYRGQENKPVILEEFSFGEDNTEQRINTWAAIMTAPAGIGTGAGIKSITAFLEYIDINEFDPAPGLVTTNNAYAITSRDGRAVVYIYNSDPVIFSQGKLDSAKGRWFDPRRGEFNGAEFDLATDRPLIVPTQEDWVLLVIP